MENNETVKWYNPIGDGSYSIDKENDELRILTGRTLNKRLRVSGLLRIRRDKRFKDRFVLHSTIRGNGQTDVERFLSAGELRVMFDCLRDIDEGDDSAYAKQYGATHGRPGCFIRAGDKVAFPCPGTARDGDPNFCFMLKPYMTKAVDRLIRTGKIKD